MSIAQVLESANMRAMIEERDEARDRLAQYEPPPSRDATICIAYYEQPQYLRQALTSALAQTVGLREVIVVDDGSPNDDTARELCANYVGEGRPVRYVRVTNRGLPNARNTGLMLAKGHGFVPLDSDDWIEPNFLEKTLPLLEQYDVVLTGLREHGVRKSICLPGVDGSVAAVTEEIEWRSNCLFYCSVYRRQLLRELGGWNGRMVHGYEDWDLWIDLLKRGARLGLVPETLFHYRTARDSMLMRAVRMKDEIVAEMRRHHA